MKDKQLKNKVLAILGTSLLMLLLTPCSSAQARTVNVKLRGVYDAKITLKPFDGMQFAKPLPATPVLKNGDQVHFSIPDSLMPGEFQIHFDYRVKETDNTSPADLQLYLNHEDIGVDANPLYLQGDSLRLTNDRENKSWSAFAAKSAQLNQQIGLLRQVLEQYDRPTSIEWNEILKAYEKRRLSFNQWVDSVTRAQKDLYVSHLYGVQKIKAENMKASRAARIEAAARHWFDGFNFNDTLLLRSRQMSEVLNGFIGLYAARATTVAVRDSLLTEAGRLACEKASAGNPRLYGWMVDYFYIGYETYNITRGMSMLENHISNPRCLTSRKLAIAKRLEGIKTLAPGVKLKNILVHNFEDREEVINISVCPKKYRLLVFYDSDCDHCRDLLAALRKWYKVPENNALLNVATIAIDQNRKTWEAAFTDNNFPWTDRYAPGGINSQAASDYYVLSAPYMYLVDKNGVLLSSPTSVAELDTALKK